MGYFFPMLELGNPLLKELGMGDFISENHLIFLAAKFVKAQMTTTRINKK